MWFSSPLPQQDVGLEGREEEVLAVAVGNEILDLVAKGTIEDSAKKNNEGGEDLDGWINPSKPRRSYLISQSRFQPLAEEENEEIEDTLEEGEIQKVDLAIKLRGVSHAKISKKTARALVDSGQFTVEHNLNHDEVKNVINHGGISDSIPTYTWLARLPQLAVTPSSGVSKALNAERCSCHHSRGVSSFTESLKLSIREASSSSTKYYGFTVIGSGVAGLRYALEVAKQGTVAVINKDDIRFSFCLVWPV
ncbi:hypothetical protein Bca52824_026629 [Brassica carinata]|uniref:Uncharacterized protein n=1 Tax=Brassica carinata TaxID=52824 RepID=A0A8X7SI25_BRACI|nr:hypothetical protein Bca52824_026629 [Brassica carinata]